MGLRITTWNVNGIRNPFGYQPWREKRTFQAMFDILEADIVIMQETKIQRKDLRDDMVLVPGWDVHFSLPRHKKGYSGVAIYTRNSVCCPIRAEEGITGVLCPPNSSTKFRDLPEDQQIGGYPRSGQLAGVVDDVTLDSEGRCVILEFPAFVLIGTYSPANRDESRDEFRHGFLEALDVRVRNLVAAGKQVILTGDLNVIGSELDVSNAVEHLRKHGMTVDQWLGMPARRIFTQLIFGGRVVGGRDEGREEPVLWDMCRIFHPTRQGMFTCWDTKKNTRPANNGSRIDYILCSSGIKDWFTDSNIQEGLMGSDHCPVFATLPHLVKSDGRDTHVLDLMNPDDMFREGKRLREWAPKDLLPMSARLIPEFDRRRSIRDMFMKKPTTIPTEIPTEPSILVSDGGNAYTPTEVRDQDPPLTPKRLETTSQATQERNTLPADDFSPKPQKSDTLYKRPAETGSLAKRPQKKSKAASDAETQSKGNAGLSQSSLKGFFKPKQPAAKPADNKEATRDKREASSVASPSKRQPLEFMRSQSEVSEGKAETMSPSKQVTTPLSTSAIEDAKDVFDPIQAKESWSKLLGKRVVPNCEHGEPCISLLTKKAGVNCGRSFYICSRPLGPSGEKEKGTEWRCGTFIWSSDWNGSQP